MIKKVLIINGVERTLVLEGTETLAQVLRDRLLLTGCKIGCGEGHCGACNVIMDGKVTRSCITRMSRVPDYAKIETIEGIGTLDNLHPLQAAWVAHGCAQCGFCSPGFIMSAKVLLENKLDASVLGGVKVCYAGKELDGTVSGRLESLRRSLTQA